VSVVVPIPVIQLLQVLTVALAAPGVTGVMLASPSVTAVMIGAMTAGTARIALSVQALRPVLTR
jgi:hypothetical protein